MERGSSQSETSPETSSAVLKTLLLTDLVGSTRLTERLGDQRASEVSARLDQLARDLLAQHGGLEIDKTDGFLLLFERPLEAVRYAVSYHRGLVALSVELELELVARAGIHVGEVLLRKNPPEQVARGAKPLEVEGVAKPMAARVMALATGRQTLMTVGAFDVARRSAKVVDNLRTLEWLFHGRYSLQGVEEPVQIFEVGVPGLSPLAAPPDGDKARRVEAPDPASVYGPPVDPSQARRRERQAGGDKLLKAPPTPSTPLLGREESLDSASERLSGGARVLTLTGQGGTGKTRFSIELFRRLAPGYAGGAAFVSLGSVTAATEVLPTVAVALDIAEAHGRTALDALCTVIGDRRVLLVLDNLEQVLDAAADIAKLVSRCPALQIIATSRSALKIGAETEFALPPLELPPSDTTSLEALRRSPSVELLLQRAEKVKPGFALTTANAAAIVAICHRLDGLPLALELAAARLRILDPTKLVQRLDNALDLLTSGDRDLPLRQRTLRATISWSYSLLEAEEQQLLCRASVFHDGWTLEAMEHVCYSESSRHRALDELDSLVEKGLVRVVDSGERFALLETIRAFATEQLHAGGDMDAARDAHADYYLGLAAEVDADMRGTSQCEAMLRARDDSANSLAAIRWLTDGARRGDTTALERGLLLCGHLNWFWHIGGQHVTARELLEPLLALAADRLPSRGRALARLAAGMILTVTDEWEQSLGEWTGGYDDGLAVGDEEIAAEGCMGIGYCHLSGGRTDAARAAMDEAIARSAGGVSDFIHGLSMTLKGMLLFASGDLDAGMALVEQARRIQEQLDDSEGGGLALSFLAQMTSAQGDQERALTLYREALASFERVGDRPEIARVHSEMGWTALAASDPGSARDSFQRAVHAHEVVGSQRGTGLALLGLAAVEAAEGRSERAVVVAAAARALSERAGVVIEHPMDPGFAGRIETLKESIPKAKLEGLVANASALSPAAVLEMIAE